jgi:peptidoglycan/LPS O-acetylase OafA/YrhL
VRVPVRTVASEKSPGMSLSASADRLPSLDGFRAISIVAVLISHLGDSLNIQYITPAGNVGVRCFFVISGFLITYLLLCEEAEAGAISLKSFYARRIVRIVPVYLLFIAFLALLTQAGWINLTTGDFIKSLTFTKDFGSGQWVDGHLWSLSVEEQFYMLWPPVLIACSSKRRLQVALVLIIICPCLRIVFYLSGWQSAYSPFTNADMLMFGCLAAMLLTQYEEPILRGLQIYTTAGRLIALCLIILTITLELNFMLGFLTVPFAWTAEAIGLAYLICSYTFVPRGIGFYLLNTFAARFIGVISYSLYIWQQPFLAHPGDYALTNFPLFRFPLNILSVFVVASLSYYGLERPLVSLRHRFRRVQTERLGVNAAI